MLQQVIGGKNDPNDRNFGFRLAFYSHFVENGTECFNQSILGKEQYVSLRRWLGEAGMLKMEIKETSGKVNERVLAETTSLADKLMGFGPYNPFPWAIMWANLAYNSTIVQHFCLNVAPGEMYDKDSSVVQALWPCRL